MRQQRSYVSIVVHGLVILAGFAALSWEVIWQLKTALALGISASGAAMTLGVTMGGMSVGSVLAGKLLPRRKGVRPLRYYALCEFAIGFTGLLLIPGMKVLEGLDTWLYQSNPGLAAPIQILGLILLLGVPALAMGATIPILGLVAKECDASLPRLYGLNTAGAAIGCLFLAFYLLPAIGVLNSTIIVASLNILVAVLAYGFAGQTMPRSRKEELAPGAASPAGFSGASVAAFSTGFITFCLEISWFRSLRSVFWSTSESFALCCLDRSSVGCTSCAVVPPSRLPC